MDIEQASLKILDDVLGLNGRGLVLGAGSPLLGALPELDSIAVVSLITTLEERFGFSVADDEIDGAVFATVGSLVAFVRRKLGSDGA